MIPRNSSTPLRASAFLFLAGLLGSAVSAQAADSLAEARSYLASGDKKAAVIELKNALQQDPGNATARLLLGETYLRLGEGASA
ncbi:MAG: tetratricopeptide repeat protein, partial [Chromatiaceae bacterium]